jgi:DTW domain-containing protein YfiP
MQTRTRIVLLMHLMEYRHQKCTTGRITCLNLANSEIIPGVEFDDVPRVRQIIDDPGNFPVLLYPGGNALRLEEADLGPADLGGRELVVFLIDGTWACARKSLYHSPGLLALPRLALTPHSPSRFVIKRQPHEWCLSTLEATHELLIALEGAGLDSYPDKSRLLEAFDAMQNLQIERSVQAGLPRYREKKPVASVRDA